MYEIDFIDIRFRKIAKEFVDLYITNGQTPDAEVAAGAYATSMLKEEDYDKLRPYVLEELADRGIDVEELLDD